MAKGISAPYGDIVYVQTPALDRWGQQLYTEQKAREARMYQENMALDASIQKELGKVRSVDTPDVINSYQRYKQITKELMFNNSLKKDPIAYNQARQAAAAEYQNIFTTANQSAEAKEVAKNIYQEKIKRPIDFNDESGQMLSALMNTPVSQIRNHPQYGDLTNSDAYRDLGMNTDWGKMLQEAIGKTREGVYNEKADLPGGLQYQITPYNYANTPLQVKDYMIGAMGMRQAGRDAAKAWDQLSEDEIANTIKAYQSLPNEYWKKMGLSEPQDLFPKNPDSKAENWAAYQAMKYAISNEPRPGKIRVENNLKAIKDLDWARQQQMQAIKQADAKSLAKYKKEIDPNDTDMNNVWYQAHLDNLIKEANESKDRHHVFTTKGRSLYYYNLIKPDQFTMKAFARNGREPDRLGVTEKGEIVPIFFKYDDKNEKVKVDGADIVDDEDSRPMSYDQALINLGYRGSTKKQLREDLNSVNHPLPKGRPRTVIQKGHTFTWNEKTGQYE